MRKELWLALATALALSGCSEAADQANNETETANAEAATPARTIADGLRAAGDSRFLAALEAAGLTPTLAGPSEYTVLVPSDQAFAALPSGGAERLMQPSERERLTGVLTYHVLPGTILSGDIDKAIENGKGRAVLATMNGATLTATRDGDRIVLTDRSGNRASIAGAEQRYKNGVVHPVDAVLMPA